MTESVRESRGKPAPLRTVDMRPNADSLIKPGELVDLVEVTPLTLNDRRIYNMLLENAWDAIDKPVVHSISKASLRGSHNSNDRIGESIERLMGSIVRVRFTVEGETMVERVQLLGGNIEHQTPDGMLHYEIPARLRRIIQNSTIFARLHKEIMFALTSKYALTLYEMVQKRGNLKYRSSESFTLTELRGVLGVPKGKLTTWSNLNNRAIRPAVAEVNQLSDYLVEIEPVKQGRKIAGVRLQWWPKDAAGVGGAARELTYSKIGRKARATGAVETIAEPSPPGVTEPLSPSVMPSVAVKRRNAVKQKAGVDAGDAASALTLQPETRETAQLRHPGYDVDFIIGEWRRWAAAKEPPRFPDKAFLAFARVYTENNPL